MRTIKNGRFELKIGQISDLVTHIRLFTQFFVEGKQEMMREIHLTRQELESREATIDDLKKRLGETKGMLEK